MNTMRYNVFNQIHKGLRAMMYDMAVQLQQSDFCVKSESRIVLSELRELLDMFEEHGRHEDDMILPLIARYNAATVHEFEKEHETSHQLAAYINQAIDLWTDTDTAADLIRLGNNIFYNFNEFVSFHLQHMNKEELLLNTILHEYYTDEEIIAAQQRIIASISPEVMMVQSKWMVRGISNNELLKWLTAVRQSGAVDVYRALRMLALSELPALRWDTLSKRLQEDCAIAV